MTLASTMHGIIEIWLESEVGHIDDNKCGVKFSQDMFQMGGHFFNEDQKRQILAIINPF